MEIRNARRKDRFCMAECNIRNLPENYEIAYWGEILVNNPNKSKILCDENGNCCGYILGTNNSIVSFAVDKKFRSKGYGGALMNKFFECATEDVALHVRIDNPSAIHLYKKCGFEIVGEKKNYYSESNGDAYRMIRKYKN